MHRMVAGGAGGGAAQRYTSTLRAVYDVDHLRLSWEIDME